MLRHELSKHFKCLKPARYSLLLSAQASLGGPPARFTCATHEMSPARPLEVGTPCYTPLHEQGISPDHLSHASFCKTLIPGIIVLFLGVFPKSTISFSSRAEFASCICRVFLGQLAITSCVTIQVEFRISPSLPTPAALKHTDACVEWSQKNSCSTAQIFEQIAWLA